MEIIWFGLSRRVLEYRPARLSGQTQYGSIRSCASHPRNESDCAAFVFANSSYPYQGARSRSSPVCRLAPQKLFNPPADRKREAAFGEVSARSARLRDGVTSRRSRCANAGRACRLAYKHGAAATLERWRGPAVLQRARASARHVGLVDPAVGNLLGCETTEADGSDRRASGRLSKGYFSFAMVKFICQRFHKNDIFFIGLKHISS